MLLIIGVNSQSKGRKEGYGPKTYSVNVINDPGIVWEIYIIEILVCLPWIRWWHPTPVLLPGKSHGQRSLVGCSPWGREDSDTTERLPFHFSLSCIGEGNGKPVQCSCLENPREGGAWWAAAYGVTQTWTWLKWLSSSSMPSLGYWCLRFRQARHTVRSCSSSYNQTTIKFMAFKI